MLRRVVLIPIAVLFIFGIIYFGQSTAAAPIYSLEMTSVTFNLCNGLAFQAQFNVISRDTQGNILNASTAAGVTVFIEASDGAMIQEVHNYTTADRGGAFIARPLTYIRMYVVSNENSVVRTDTYEVRCDGTLINLGGAQNAGGGGSTVKDDRLNFAQGDLINVLYARRDSKQQSEVHVYGVNPSNSQGFYIGKFSYDDFKPYLSSPPQTNVRIRTIGKSTLFALTSGEFQINIISEAEKKTYTMIFSGLPPKNIYFRTLE